MKVFQAIKLTLCGIRIDVRFLQPEKTLLYSFCRPFSKVTELRSVQFEKTEALIVFTLLGITIEVNPAHPANALDSRNVTLLGMKEFLHPLIKWLEAVTMMALQFSRESYTVFPSLITIDSRPLHPGKALPNAVTLLGITREVKLLQFLKAHPPIYVTPSGIFTEVRPLQPSNA
jgi:hypothetical protein